MSVKCLLSGVKQTSRRRAATSVLDPGRTCRRRPGDSDLSEIGCGVMTDLQLTEVVAQIRLRLG